MEGRGLAVAQSLYVRWMARRRAFPDMSSMCIFGALSAHRTDALHSQGQRCGRRGVACGAGEKEGASCGRQRVVVVVVVVVLRERCDMNPSSSSSSCGSHLCDGMERPPGAHAGRNSGRRSNR